MRKLMIKHLGIFVWNWCNINIKLWITKWSFKSKSPVYIIISWSSWFHAESSWVVAWKSQSIGQEGKQYARCISYKKPSQKKSSKIGYWLKPKSFKKAVKKVGNKYQTSHILIVNKSIFVKNSKNSKLYRLSSSFLIVRMKKLQAWPY